MEKAWEDGAHRRHSDRWHDWIHSPRGVVQDHPAHRRQPRSILARVAVAMSSCSPSRSHSPFLVSILLFAQAESNLLIFSLRSR